MHGIELNTVKQAQLAFATRLYQESVDLWNKAGETPKEYHRAMLETVSYPDNHAHWKPAQLEKWKESVVAEFRKNPGIQIEDAGWLVIGEAVLEEGESSEVRRVLPIVLSNLQSMDEAHKWINGAYVRDHSLPKTLLEPLLLYRWTDLRDWRAGQQKYQDPEAENLMTMIRALQVIHTQEFLDKLNHAFSERRALDVLSQRFENMNRNQWNHLFFTNLGAIIEKRGYYLDSSRYYAWAVQQSDDPVFKKEMWIRWIVSRERHAEIEKNPQYAKEAAAKRDDYKIAHDVVFSTEPRFDHWRILFEKVMALSDKPRETTQNKELYQTKSLDAEVTSETEEITNDSVVQQVDSEEDKAVNVNETDRLFDFDTQGYRFRFNPVKNELIISLRTDVEDLRVKIKNGVFPGETDFYLDEGRLKKSDGTDTPFKVNPMQGHIRVTIEGSGVIWLFYPSSKNKGKSRRK